MPKQQHVLIVDGDTRPRTRAKTARHLYVVPTSRLGLGEFLATQLWARGYFVTVASLQQRRSKAGLPLLESDGLETRVFTDPISGRRFRGVWAWTALSRHSALSVDTLKTLVAGAHRRSPELLTVLKVFRALGLELKAAESRNTNVDLIVKGW